MSSFAVPGVGVAGLQLQTRALPYRRHSHCNKNAISCPCFRARNAKFVHLRNDSSKCNFVWERGLRKSGIVSALSQSSGEISDSGNTAPSKAYYHGRVQQYVLSSCLGPFVTGYNFGVVNGAFAYILKTFQLEKSVVFPARLLGSVMLSAALGSFLTSLLTEKYGRVRTLQLSAIPLAIGTILSTAAQNFTWLIIGQLWVGIGIGIITSTVPLYIFEITPAEAHGSFTSLSQLFIWIGVFVGLVTGIPLAGNPQWWRVMFLINILPTAFMVHLLTVSPESPFWLIQQGNTVDTRKAIEMLWGDDRVEEVLDDLTKMVNSKDLEVEASWSRFSLRNIKNVILTAWERKTFQNWLAGLPKKFRKSLYALPKRLMFAIESFLKQNKIGIILNSYIERIETTIEGLFGKKRIKEEKKEDLDKEKENLNDVTETAVAEHLWFQFLPKHFDKVAIGAALIFFQQISGVNVLVFYTVATDWIARMPFSIAASSVLVTTLILGNVLASVLLNSKGWKNLLKASFSGMAASILLLIVSISELMESDYSYVAVIALMLYVGTFALGASLVPSVAIPEILPYELRPRGISFLMGLQWVATFFLASYAFNRREKMHLILFLEVFALCVAAVKFVQVYVVEAKPDLAGPGYELVSSPDSSVQEDVLISSPDTSVPGDVLSSSPDTSGPGDELIFNSDSSGPGDKWVSNPDTSGLGDELVTDSDTAGPGDGLDSKL